MTPSTFYTLPSPRNYLAERAQQTKPEEFRDWDPDKTKWEPWLPLKASTFKIRQLFPEVEPAMLKIPLDSPQHLFSPTKKYFYRHTIVPTRYALRIYKKTGGNGISTGYALFDGPVVTPALFETTNYPRAPWMSMTPMELMTLRPGTKRAKGDVVIAGMGLGHQLIEVAKRDCVKKITLIERDSELIEWLYPAIKKHLNGREVEIIVDNAWKVLPKLSADIALIDTYATFGWNSIEWTTKIVCPNIRAWWSWG